MLDAFNEQEYQKAIDFAEEAIKEKPLSPQQLVIKGRSQISLGRSEEGIETLSEAIRIKAEYNEAYFFRAIAYYFQDDFEKGKEDLQYLLEQEPDNKEYLEFYASNRFQAADYSEAIAVYSSLVRLNPSNAENYIQRASAKRENQLFDEAVVDLHQALSLDSTSSFAYEEMGQVFAEKGEYQLAIEQFNLSMEYMANDEIAPIRAAIWDSRGFAYLNSGQMALAKEDLERSIAIFPNAAAFKNLGLIALRKNDIEQACVNLRQAEKYEAYYSKTAATIASLIEEHCHGR
ncbi:MAG: tetratricopeptide repeat protein [Calditrichia bacterium]